MRRLLLKLLKGVPVEQVNRERDILIDLIRAFRLSGYIDMTDADLREKDGLRAFIINIRTKLDIMKVERLRFKNGKPVIRVTKCPHCEKGIKYYV